MNNNQFSPDSVGEILKRAREGQRRTCEEVADITKIPQKYIEALENGSFDNFPNIKDFHIRSYIGKLCSLYSIPPEQIIQQYFANSQHEEKKNKKVNERVLNGAPETYHRKAKRSGDVHIWGLGNLSGWVIGFCSIVAVVIILSLIFSFFKQSSTTGAFPQANESTASRPIVTERPVNQAPSSSDSIAVERFISVPAIRQARIPDKDY